jgi:hypothetical protein
MESLEGVCVAASALHAVSLPAVGECWQTNCELHCLLTFAAAFAEDCSWFRFAVETDMFALAVA